MISNKNANKHVLFSVIYEKFKNDDGTFDKTKSIAI